MNPAGGEYSGRAAERSNSLQRSSSLSPRAEFAESEKRDCSYPAKSGDNSTKSIAAGRTMRIIKLCARVEGGDWRWNQHVPWPWTPIFAFRLKRYANAGGLSSSQPSSEEQPRAGMRAVMRVVTVISLPRSVMWSWFMLGDMGPLSCHPERTIAVAPADCRDGLLCRTLSYGNSARKSNGGRVPQFVYSLASPGASGSTVNFPSAFKPSRYIPGSLK